MRLRTLLVPAAAFAVALAIFAALSGSEPAVDPSRTSRATVGAGASTDERLAALRARLATRPQDAELAATLGDTYLQKARETADARFYVEADRAFATALRTDPEQLRATVGAGTLALARHDFRKGLEQGRRAAALAPQANAPLPVLVDAFVELGRLPEAEAAAQRLVDRRPGVAAFTRISYLRELRGDIAGAVSALRLAVEAAAGAPEGTAFAQNLLGTLERGRGRPAAARAAYAAALAADPASNDAQAGLAALDAAAGRMDGALARLRRAADASTTPEHRTLLGEYLLAAGRTAAGRAELAKVVPRRRLLVAGGEDTDTESALFEAQHGDPALGVRLGRRAWAAAPNVRSAHALGWALTQAGRAREGSAWGRRALRLGWRDPLAVYHAGLSAKAAGEPGDARRLLRGLLARSPDFSPLYAPRARRALREIG